ncbi:hypothetical protein TBR22_A41370 [Luteitalea sp. TBR-22]|uniref:S8 family serine peptidase n=1 Tax=Luteitalea sp. TBR-22 TaxID=2802971 RepID=UPI001AF2C1CD|nr:S8 family serine peptidase [Luteitalea sp. TBR-22]BCS34911.1 hypothetical protein TBR22_A41370 [Luteitalea sp. TBR-22]
MRRARLLRALTLALLVVAGAAPASAQAPAIRLASGQPADGASGARLGQLRARVVLGTSVRLLVGMRLPAGVTAATSRSSLRPAVGRARNAVLARIGSRGRSVRAATTLPVLVVTVDLDGLDALVADPDVATLEEDFAAASRLTESVPLVQADQLWSEGYRGTGWAVAVLDDGVEASHPAFGGRVVQEACFSGATVVANSQCPNGATSQVGLGAAAPCATCTHGTHVAGIAAGNSGVAPDAPIVAVQVFSKDALAYYSDILLAIDHVLTLADTMGIAALNLSIGSGSGLPTPCDATSSSMYAAFAALRAAGIAPVVAAGNSGATTNGLEFPGCLSNAVSVGATDDADAVASFGNTASGMQLFAPGVGIVAPVPGGGTAARSGTSMATPHVAGAWALLKQRLPTASVTAVLTALRSTGLSIFDSGTGVSFPRIRIALAAEAMAAFTVTPASWSAAPAGGTESVALTSAADGATWSASSNASWLGVSPASGVGSATVTLTASANAASALSRTATATVAGHQVTVTQAGSTATFTLSSSAWMPAAAGGTHLVTVTSSLADAPWTATTSQPWLTASASSGTGNGSVTLTASVHASSAQPRTATATIAGRTVSVTQDGYSISLSPASAALPAAGGVVSLSASVTPPSVAWTASSDVGWATVSPTSGTGSGHAAITVAANPSVSPRTGQLLIGGHVVTVSQDGAIATFSVSPGAISEPAQGGSHSVIVTSTIVDAPWTATSPAPWISVTPASGVGTGAVSVTVAPHGGSDARSATLTVAGRAIAVSQAPHPPTARTAEDAWIAPAAGGVHELTLDVPAALPAWRAWTDAAWITVSPLQGQGDARVSIAALPASSDGAGLAVMGVPSPLPSGSATVMVTQAHADGVRTATVVFVPAAAPSTYTRYLAEGATSSFFDTRLALLNPGDTDTIASLQYLRAGRSVVEQTVPLPAHARRTVWPRDADGLDQAEFSTVVTASVPIVVDRTMTWDGAGYGAHAETAAADASSRWYFAEGATHSGFSLFYLLQNPGDDTITVQARFLRAAGPPLEKTYDLAPRSRTTVWANVEDFAGLGRALASDEFSAVLESVDGAPFIAERAMYRSTRAHVFDAGHEVMGVAAPTPRWFLAEGRTGAYFDMFVLVANPSDVAADVRLTYLLETGQTLQRSFIAPATSRSTIWVDQERFAGTVGLPLADAAVSTTVESLNGVPLVVERAMWWPGDGSSWYEAHASAGATQAGTAWALAEGEAGGPAEVETYVLIANTSTTPGRARVTVVLEDGTTHDRVVALAPSSRTSVAIQSEFADVVRDTRFGVIVEALGLLDGDPLPSIVVERAMYGDADSVHWAAGTNALATRLR